jgi:hypothetical protein
MNRIAACCSRPYSLQVGEPAAFGFIMGMADIISGSRALAANFTNFRHGRSSFLIWLQEMSACKNRVADRIHSVFRLLQGGVQSLKIEKGTIYL